MLYWFIVRITWLGLSETYIFYASHNTRYGGFDRLKTEALCYVGFFFLSEPSIILKITVFNLQKKKKNDLYLFFFFNIYFLF